MVGVMSSRGKAAGAHKRKTLAHRAGLQFPVARVHRYLKSAYLAPHVSVLASVYLAGILEYLSAEVLELAGDVVRNTKTTRINPRHILLAVRGDKEINSLFSNVTIPEGGVVPQIHSALLSKKSQNSLRDSKSLKSIQ
nr:histone H2A-beta, sperm-like [Cherax quadricarinatus]